jgi:hypothetical protein
MPCSDAKLAILADRYGFDLDEAREYIGLPPVKKSPAPRPPPNNGVIPANSDKKIRRCSLCGMTDHNKRSCPGRSPHPDKFVEWIKKPAAAQPALLPKGGHGYDLYVKTNKSKLITEVKSKVGHGQTLPTQKILAMLAYDWNQLSDYSRKQWNLKALV